MAFTKVLVFALMLGAAVAKHNPEVTELGENNGRIDISVGPTGAYNGDSGPDDSWGTAQGTRVLNMPGPAYGKPGYKESHNWEQDVDVFAPVVFQWKFYRAMYSDELDGKTQAEVKAHWKTTALAETVTYPNCQQASSQFSLNMYYRANPSLEASTKGVCAKILNDYLANGIYDGKPTVLANAEKVYQESLSADDLSKYITSPKGKARAVTIRKGSATEWALNRESGDMGIVIDAEKYYTYTFWFQMLNTVEQRGNILKYGGNSPKISMAPDHGKYMEVISAQSNSDQWGCNTPDTDEFQFKSKTWTHVAVVAEDKKLTVYLNGVKAVDCTNTGGEIKVSKDQTLFVPAAEDYADGKIKSLKYWGGSPLNAELVKVEHSNGPDA